MTSKTSSRTKYLINVQNNERQWSEMQKKIAHKSPENRAKIRSQRDNWNP